MCTEGVHQQRKNFVLDQEFHVRRRRKPTTFRTSADNCTGGSNVNTDGTVSKATATADTAGQPVDDVTGDFNNSEKSVLTVDMTSENDDEPALSLDSDRRPSLVPATATAGASGTAAKGILMHNKKSANTNRVSFVTNSPSRCTSASSTTSSVASSPSTPAKRSTNNSNHRHNKNKYNADSQRSRKQSVDEQLPYYARTGRRLTGFGIKSYLNDFYDDPESRDESFEDDDFKYCVEPEIHWRRHCCGTYAAIGLVIMAMGAVTMMIGHLMPVKDPVVGRSTNMEVIDRWAVTYNENLASCRYVGSVALAIGVVFTVVRFWISVLRGKSGSDDDDERSAAEKKLGEQRLSSSSANHHRPCQQQQQPIQPVRISISGCVENVQPDPRTINVRISDSN